MSEPTTVLYIAGSGRTGSTLLERMLGQLDDLGTYGELRFIWERGYQENWLCGCGQPFHECSFWQAVLAETFGQQSPDLEPILNLSHTVDRTRYIPQILGWYRTSTFSRNFTAYTRILERLFQAIQHVSGKPIIVDASKFDATGFLLSQMPTVQFHVLHLVRDSRAVAYSWQRNKHHLLSDGTTRPQLRRGPIRSALEWFKQNVSAEFMQYRAASYKRVRYEDFIPHPRETIEQILVQAGAVANDLSFIEAHEVTLNAETHTVAGNPNRMDTGIIKLREDTEWRNGLSRRDYRLVTLLTWPLLLRYGYSL